MAEAGFDQHQRRLLELAVCLTESPGTTSAQQIANLVSPLGEEEYLDACFVITGFHFINRIALALGVRSDIRFDFLGPPLAWTIRAGGLVDFSRRELSHYQPAAQSLARLTDLFHAHKLGRLPAFFERLTSAAYLLHALVGLLDASLETLNEPLRSVVMQTAGECCTTSGAQQLSGCLEHGRVGGESSIVTNSQDASLAFALRINREPHTLGQADVDALRRTLRDEEILDLVFGVAVWNCLARLERLAPPLIGRSREMPAAPTNSGKMHQ